MKPDRPGDIHGERTDQLDSIPARTPAQEEAVFLVAMRTYGLGGLPAVDLPDVLEALGLIGPPPTALTRAQELRLYRTVACEWCEAQVGRPCRAGHTHNVRKDAALAAYKTSAGQGQGHDPTTWVAEARLWLVARHVEQNVPAY